MAKRPIDIIREADRSALSDHGKEIVNIASDIVVGDFSLGSAESKLELIFAYVKRIEGI